MQVTSNAVHNADQLSSFDTTGGSIYKRIETLKVEMEALAE